MTIKNLPLWNQKINHKDFKQKDLQDYSQELLETENPILFELNWMKMYREKLFTFTKKTMEFSKRIMRLNNSKKIDEIQKI